MRTAVIILAALAELSNGASAGTFVLRSSATGPITAPVVTTTPEEPTTPGTPAGFTMSIAGQASVAAGAALDLRPVIAGALGSVSYSYSGSLPLGATFAAATGRIAGRALIAGSYRVRILVTDSSGATVTVAVTIAVT